MVLNFLNVEYCKTANIAFYIELIPLNLESCPHVNSILLLLCNSSCYWPSETVLDVENLVGQTRGLSYKRSSIFTDPDHRGHANTTSW